MSRPESDSAPFPFACNPHLQLVWEGMSDGLFVHRMLSDGSPGPFELVNPAACRNLGYSSEELLAMSPLELDDPAVSTLYIGLVMERLREKGSVVFEAVQRHRNGERLPVEVSTSLVEEGEVTYLVSTVRYLQQRLLTSEELIEKNERLRLIIEAAGAGSWEWEPGSCQECWSEHLWELYGLKRGSCASTFATWLDTVCEEDREGARESIHRAVEAARPFSVEWRVKGSDPPRWLLSKGQPLTDADGRLLRYIGIVVDITERRQAELESSGMERLVKSMVEAFPSPFYLIDRSGRYAQWNSYQQEVVIGPGREVREVPPLETFHPDDRAMVAQKIAAIFDNGVSQVGEARVFLHGGPDFRWYLLTGARIMIEGEPFLIGAGTDITELKQATGEKAELEAQLQQSQKLEVVGRLAGGIAHDFNNMLSVIIGHAESLLDGFPEESLEYTHVRAILTAAEKSAGLTRQLLAFARKQRVKPVSMVLDAAIEATMGMLKRLIGEQVALDWQPGAPGVSVLMDPSQLSQLLTNLAINARDSMEGNGRVTIATSLEEVGDTRTALITISDEGSGISPDVLPHIFEPFFTTKPTGKGTGLGLATVYGIVRQNGGTIQAENGPNGGTSMLVRLAVAAPSPAPAPPAGVASRGEGVAGRERLILVVEDEPDILKLCRTILEKEGYRVRTASSGDEALGIAAEEASGIELLLTDVVMPGLNGRELAQGVAEFAGAFKVLYMSGYTADIIGQHGVVAEDISFIQKPFTMQQLADRVSELLAAEPG